LPGIYIAVTVPLLVNIDAPSPGLLRGADYLSIVLLAISLGCLEYTLEEGPRWGWFDDGTLTITGWLALLCGIAFVIRTLRHFSRSWIYGHFPIVHLLWAVTFHLWPGSDLLNYLSDAPFSGYGPRF
jgi:hypothetical protein